MDRNFFEFWGQLFLNVAQGQKQIEEMNALFRPGPQGYDAMRTIFHNTYGLDNAPESFAQNSGLWETAAQNFQASLRQVMKLWGVVPGDDYQALVRKCETLEKTATEQEQTIRHLKLLLGERQDEAFSSTKELQALLTKQQAEFQKMVNTLGVLLPEKTKAAAAKKR